MASISADLTTTLIGLTSRRSTQLPWVGAEAALFPLTWRPRTFPHSQTLRYSTSSFCRALVAKPNRGYRRFTAAASSTTTSQSESSDIEPDNRIPATIITGFLGSGKVRCSFGNLWPVLIGVSLFECRINLHCLLKCTCEMELQTTLLNHILTAEHGKRIAVIENELIVVIVAFFVVYVEKGSKY
ncbi:hypothetical protein DVH24_000064 [Malus domestica]|uniref:Uncharacterized protein n=1 Tax=Malus domestica TaxID=3750 RepID=A0A498J1D6_MALDO|nr:hypothetical protein DVH24_000064 [Malus domestica]